MAKRRLNPDEIRAAVEAGPPPHSVNYETDKKWHAEQNRWLAKWTERRLPDSGDSGSSRGTSGAIESSSMHSCCGRRRRSHLPP